MATVLEKVKEAQKKEGEGEEDSGEEESGGGGDLDAELIVALFYYPAYMTTIGSKSKSDIDIMGFVKRRLLRGTIKTCFISLKLWSQIWRELLLDSNSSFSGESRVRAYLRRGIVPIPVFRKYNLNVFSTK